MAGDVPELKGLGGFKNIRKVCSWEGYTLEIDETIYDWGTVYEVECETDKPVYLRDSLSAWLQKQSIDFEFNTTTKFQNFVNKSLV